VEERETVAACLRHIAFLDVEIERVIALDALDWPDVRRLMTVPGVNVIVAATFLAAVGDIRRFPTSRQIVGYLDLDPKVRPSCPTRTPSATGPLLVGHEDGRECDTGARISKALEGQSRAADSVSPSGLRSLRQSPAPTPSLPPRSTTVQTT
jgi:hypothetical protein